MKKIEAVIRPEKFNEVKESLKKIGYPGMTVTHIEGHGRQKGLTEQFRGREFRVELIPKTKIEIVVKDKDVKTVLETIRESAHTGEIGDGKIFIIPIENALRIRTDEKGEKGELENKEEKNGPEGDK